MRAAVQVLKKTEDLKQQTAGEFLNDNDAWNRHRKLQDLYQELLVVDLEYALDKKVEQDLWNHVFKNHINRLQSQAKDRKNPQRTESQENLAWFLETASGFYLQLLQELCEAFDLDVPCRRKGSVYGVTKEIKPFRSEIAPPQKSSSLYICQHCLVHMGDIARYRNQSLQAETFYRHAADLIPSNGQPYNQLAILEAAKGDKLSTVFYYVRSIAVKHPFPVAMTNLQKMYSKIVNDEFLYEGKTKLSVYDYVSAFLQFHTLVHLTSDLERARQLGKTLAANLTILIATESLSAWKLIQMMAINLFAVEHATHGIFLLEANATTTTTTAATENRMADVPLSEDEQTVYNLVLELVASTLNGILLLVYTMKEDSELRSYYALPVLKIALEWLRENPSHLKAASFTSKFQIWPSLCKLLNSIQLSLETEFDGNKYASVPLPEDWDLQSFLPLQKAHKTYKFRETFQPSFTPDDELSLRAYRLVVLGQWLCEQEIYGVKLMTVESAKDGCSSVTFEAITPQTPSTDVLKLLEEMTIGLCTLPPSGQNRQENGCKVGGGDLKETNEKSIFVAGNVIGQGVDSRPTSNGRDSAVKNVTADVSTNRTLLTNSRRTRQNVALQTIMQKKSLGGRNDSDDGLKPLKSEGKMVTFKTPSPSPPASSGGGTPPLVMATSVGAATASAAIHASQQQQQQQQHIQPPVYPPVAHFKPSFPIPSSYGNGMDPNSTTTSRNQYSGVQTIDLGYSVKQATNKLGMYGSNDISQPNYLSHLYGGGGGQGGPGPLRSPPVREQMNGGQVLNHPPQPLSSAAQHHALLTGYNHTNLPMNRHQPPPQPPSSTLVNQSGLQHGLQNPQNRIPLNHAGVVAAALANQKQASFVALNSTMFGPGSHVSPPPPPPPWFHKPPNMEHQFMSQLSGVHGSRVAHMLSSQAQQSTSAHQQQMPYPYGAVSRNQQQQQFPQPPDANHFVYQMMGHISDSFSGAFPNSAASASVPPPSLAATSHPANVAATVRAHALTQAAQECPLEAMNNSAIDNTIGHVNSRHHQQSGGGGIIGAHFDGQTGQQHCQQQQQQQQHMDQQSPGRRSLQNADIHERHQNLEKRAEASADNMPSTYSLFNSPWSSGLNVTTGSGVPTTTAAAAAAAAAKDKREVVMTTSNGDELEGFLQPGLQSLWSGPGPSPLERLLEQQKLKKDSVPH